MSEPKLPTLWVTEFGAEFLRKPSQYADNRSVSARTEAMPDGVPYVPAARLDAANLEIARLKGDAAGLRVILKEAQKAIRSSGAAELNEETGKWEHVHKPLLNVIKAALTPKEP